MIHLARAEFLCRGYEQPVRQKHSEGRWRRYLIVGWSTWGGNLLRGMSVERIEKRRDATYCKREVVLGSLLVRVRIECVAELTKEGNVSLSLLSAHLISIN